MLRIIEVDKNRIVTKQSLNTPAKQVFFYFGLTVILFISQMIKK